MASRTDSHVWRRGRSLSNAAAPSTTIGRRATSPTQDPIRDRVCKLQQRPRLLSAGTVALVAGLVAVLGAVLAMDMWYGHFFCGFRASTPQYHDVHNENRGGERFLIVLFTSEQMTQSSAHLLAWVRLARVLNRTLVLPASASGGHLYTVPLLRHFVDHRLRPYTLSPFDVYYDVEVLRDALKDYVPLASFDRFLREYRSRSSVQTALYRTVYNVHRDGLYPASCPALEAEGLFDPLNETRQHPHHYQDRFSDPFHRVSVAESGCTGALYSDLELLLGVAVQHCGCMVLCEPRLRLPDSKCKIKRLPPLPEEEWAKREEGELNRCITTPRSPSCRGRWQEAFSEAIADADVRALIKSEWNAVRNSDVLILDGVPKKSDHVSGGGAISETSLQCRRRWLEYSPALYEEAARFYESIGAPRREDFVETRDNRDKVRNDPADLDGPMVVAIQLRLEVSADPQRLLNAYYDEVMDTIHESQNERGSILFVASDVGLLDPGKPFYSNTNTHVNKGIGLVSKERMREMAYETIIAPLQRHGVRTAQYVPSKPELWDAGSYASIDTIICTAADRFIFLEAHMSRKSSFAKSIVSRRFTRGRAKMTIDAMLPQQTTWKVPNR